MKRILVTSRLVRDPLHGEVRDALDTRWGGFLKEVGIIPVVIPSLYGDMAALEEIGCDGILLTGGNDIAAISSNALDLERERRERSLIAYACSHAIPLLGVCRGMQLLVSYFGGTVHRVDGHVGCRHPINVVHASEVFGAKDQTFATNSYHHVGIASLPSDCVLIAESADGSIEAMQHFQLPCYGIMWHPEREHPLSKYDLNIFQNIFRI